MKKICFLSMDDLTGYVSDDELAIVEEVCGAPMERSGYPRIGGSGPEGGRGPGRSRRPPPGCPDRRGAREERLSD